MADNKNIVYFNSYEELSDYCYPFEKNLSNGISDEQRFILLKSIAKYYRQRLDEISAILEAPYTMLVNVSKSGRFWGRCGIGLRIIELHVALICLHPLVLTEVIIHELTHYEEIEHNQNFYNCMIKNIKKMGLQKQLYGYSSKIRGRNSEILRAYEPDNEKLKIITKCFHIPITKRSLCPPIANGALPDFLSWKEFTNFCAPYYKNLPRVTGLLDKIKIITYAELYFKKLITDLSMRLQLKYDFTKINIYISNDIWFFDGTEMGVPLYLIAMNETLQMNVLVCALTNIQVSGMGLSDDYVKENLSKLELLETHSTSIFLFDNFVKKWKNCFGADGRKVMKYIPVAKI